MNDEPDHRALHHYAGLNSEFVVLDRLPQLPFPERRLEGVLDSLDLDRTKTSLQSAEDVERWMTSKVAALDVIRRAATSRERSLLGFRGARSIVLGVFPDLSRLEIEVDGCDEAELRTVDLTVGTVLQDPLLPVRLLQGGQLRRGESVGRVTYSSGSGSRAVSHPIVAAVEALSQKTNGSDRWESLPTLSISEAQQLILLERRAQAKIVNGLRDSFKLSAPDPDLAQASLHVFLSRRTEEEDAWTGWTAAALTVADGRGDVRVSVGPGPSMRWPVSDAFARQLGVEDAALIVRETNGVADHVLGTLAGVERLRVNPDSSPPPY